MAKKRNNIFMYYNFFTDQIYECDHQYFAVWYYGNILLGVL